MRSISLLCAAIFSVALAFAQTAKPVSAFEQQLIDQQKQFLQAIQSKNSTAVNRAVADDFRGIKENGDLIEKGDLLDDDQASPPKETRAYDFRVVKLNDASAVVAYNLIAPGENPRYTHVADTWTKIDGRWQLKFRQITPNLWSANDLD
jgi:hypothetical protein